MDPDAKNVCHSCPPLHEKKKGIVQIYLFASLLVLLTIVMELVLSHLKSMTFGEYTSANVPMVHPKVTFLTKQSNLRYVKAICLTPRFIVTIM